MRQTELFQSPFTGIVKPKKKREMSEFTNSSMIFMSNIKST